MTDPAFIDKWSPALQIRTVLLSIQALLSAPNPDDPLANDVAQHWKDNDEAAIATGKSIHICVYMYVCCGMTSIDPGFLLFYYVARQWTAMYASN